MLELKGMKGPDEGQSIAIYHGEGPMLVLAGPGSGKTYVITQRIKYLIEKSKISPDHILVITFTKAAALEMQARANLLMEQSAYVHFGTFHSVFYQILNLSRFHSKLKLASDKERMDFVRAYLKETLLETEDLENTAESCLKEISRRKNMFPEAEETGNGIKGVLREQTFSELYEAYKEWLSENKKLDFDDMILMCHIYLKENSAEREKWQNRFSYILIDEFQDINRLQYETVKLLVKNGNIFGVGDDDQAIYGFRGSDPMLMKRFMEEFAPKVVKLSNNYRCGSEIVELASRSISKNKMRFPKNIKAVKKEEGRVLIKGFPSEENMRNYIIGQIENFESAHPKKTQAVLTRTNKEGAVYSHLINKKEESFVLKDLLAYLSFINCGRKREDFFRIMNKPMRYIGHGVVNEDPVSFPSMKKRLKDKPWILKRVEKLEEQINFVKRLDFYGQLHYIYKSMGYEQYIKEEWGENPSRIKECTKEFSMLSSMVKKCKSIEELKVGILGKTFEESEGTVENKEGYNGRDYNKNKQDKSITGNVKIMTYHGAKGLEFDRVYLPGINYGKVPHGRMLSMEQLEEERRMFYVAMTRAKEELFLVYEGTEKRTSGQDSVEEGISPFLEEIIK